MEEETPASDRLSLKPLYLMALFAGLAFAVYLYGVAFDELSESELVTLSPAWVILLVFGVTGLAADSAAKRVAAGEAEDLAEGLRAALQHAPIVRVFLLPLLIFNAAKATPSAFLVAIYVAGVWALLLYFFFVVIFDQL